MARKKKITPKKFVIGMVTYTLLFAGGAEKIGGSDSDNICGGKERWEQKVLTDNEASTINETAEVTTIEALTKINTKTKDTKYMEGRARMGIESSFYTIKNCFITDVLRENDNDLHLVIEDGYKHTMIAEIPDPNCASVKQSPWLADFVEARKTMLDNANSYRHYLFTVTGPLFVDRSHGQTGRAPNNVEIHPIIELKRGKKINPIAK